jgi:hypothetical protein
MLRPGFLLILICSGSVMAAPLYEVTDAKGNVTYTDKPPAASHEGESKAIEQKSLNVLESPPNQDFQKSFDRNRAKAKETRDSAWGAYDKALYGAEQKLKSALAARKEGEAVKEGDMIGTYNPNGSHFMRPSEEYLERQEALKRAVIDAETELSAIKKSKPMLRRN